MRESEGLPEAVSSTWQRLVDEAEETAAEYRDDDWEAVVVHPGDITAVSGAEYFGLSVLAPDSEYDRVRSLVRAHEFDRSEVYRRVDGSLVFFLCVFESTADEIALVVPAYVTADDLDVLFPRAREAGEMRVHVRPLEYEERATLTVADPDPFFASESA